MKINEIKKGDKLTIIFNKRALNHPRAQKVYKDVIERGRLVTTHTITDIQEQPGWWPWFCFDEGFEKLNEVSAWHLVKGRFDEWQLLHMSRMPKPLATFLVNGQVVEDEEERAAA